MWELVARAHTGYDLGMTLVSRWCGTNMTKPKRKVTLSLDSDSLEDLRKLYPDASLSSLVEAAVIDRVALARQRQTLNSLRAEYEAEHGPVDEAKIRAAMASMQR